MIFAQGSRFGGHALIVKDNRLSYIYNFLGIPPEKVISASAPTSGSHIVGVEFTKERVGEHHEPIGPDEAVRRRPAGRGHRRDPDGRSRHFSLCGEGLCIGYDGGDRVSTSYPHRFEFTGGRIVKVVFDVADDAYVDVERHFAAAMARD